MNAGRGEGLAGVVAEMVAGASGVVVLTGAGMSAESGVPTFRDALTGWWSRYDPTELATPEAFRRNPGLVFGWYLTRLRLAERAEPHDGHRALAWLGRRIGVALVTQNVDGLHGRAGSEGVVELHGSLRAFRCADGGHPYPVEAVLRLPEAGGDGPVSPPACPDCGSPIRPGVVWFGEPLPPAAVERAWQLAGSAEVMLCVGTSSVVYPAAELPAVARTRGAKVVEINPARTPLSRHVDVHWPSQAGSALPRLVDALQARQPT